MFPAVFAGRRIPPVAESTYLKWLTSIAEKQVSPRKLKDSDSVWMMIFHVK
jgi:hypothetical protein